MAKEQREGRSIDSPCRFFFLLLLLVSLLSQQIHASSLSSSPPYRVLTCDVFWPTDVAKWRIEEIYALTERFHTDILTTRRLPPDYLRRFPPVYSKELNERFRLSERYDILIFDPNYNYLNQHNQQGFDGTAFNFDQNEELLYSYMFRRREYRNESFSFAPYEAVSYIFLRDLVKKFRVPIPNNKKWVKLFPGGGLVGPDQLNLLRKQPHVGVVITTPVVEEWWRQSGLRNEVVYQPMGTLIQKDTVRIPKPVKPPSEKVAICMTFVGNSKQKGENVFARMLEIIDTEFPDVRENIEVYMVGPNSTRPGVQYTGLMNQEQLDTFYREKIDIYVNPEPGLHFNGWPLGTEAMLQGSVMITTDPHNMNDHYHFTKDEMVIVPVGGAREMADAIVELVNDRGLLHKISNTGQKRLFEILDYDNGIGKVFGAIEARMDRERERRGRL